MTREWIERLRWWMLRSQQNHVLAGLYRETSKLVMWMAGRRLMKVRGVAAIFSRHTHPRSATFVPGQSDLDLTVILEDNHAEDPRCIRECSRAMEELSRRYLFTKAEDARFMSTSELSRLTKTFCAPSELLYRPENWLLVAGREVRTEKSCPFPTQLVPRHPQFNQWWANVIQTQFFRPDGGLKKGYLRSLYRSAVKNQVHLEAAKGVNVVKPDGFVSDELSDLKFTESPRLRSILATIKKKDFWAESPEQQKPEIFLEVLKSTENFFTNYRLFHTTEESTVPQSAPASRSFSAETENIARRARGSNEPHDSVYRALKESMANAPGITEALRSAVVYPLPHAYPYVYKVDLLLRQNLSLGEFVEVCALLDRFWGGKNFTLAGAPLEFTLIPSKVYQEPLFFLGSDCPFLLEHIRQFGDAVYGDDRPYAAIGWSRSDLFDWCRVYLPFHMATFRRRLEYGSPVLNFCQLASLRIFLEKGEKLTDPLETRDQYLGEFVKSEKDRDVVDFLFRYPGASAPPALFGRALGWVSDTYGQLESLVGVNK